MSARTTQLVHHLQRLAAASDPASDADLLERFIHRRDESAFAGLVGRYGPMVLLVCRRMLADAHTAEDCMQATFLVLARKAASLRRRDSLAAFLHTVACRTARRARADRSRRGAPELPETAAARTDPRPDPLSELTARELLTAVDQEVERLPEVYRLPVVLCCLEGLSLEEAARRLGWTAGSVKGRLERGRKRLHDRLTRRGLTLTAALSAVEASRGFALSAPLLLGTGGCGVGTVSSRVAALADGAFPAGGMMTRLTIAAVLLSVGVVAGAGVLLQRPSAKPAPARQEAAGASVPAAKKPGADDPGEPLPPGAVARMGSIRFCSGTTVQSAAFSPDGKTLASGNAYGTASLWDVATGKEIRVFHGRQGAMTSVAFSPDGALLAGRGEDGVVYLWDSSSGKQVRRIEATAAPSPPSNTGSTGWAFRIAFSPDGKTLAAAPGDLTGRDSEIRLWNVADGKEIRRLRGHQGAVRTFAFAPDGTSLASGGADKTVRLWNPESGKQLHLLRGSLGGVASLAYSPDGKTLASGSDDRVIRLWSAAGKELRQVAAPGTVKSLVFINEGTLAWGDEKGVVHLIDLKTSKELRRMARHAYGVSDLCRSSDGKTLASVGDGQDHAVHLWQAATGKRLSPPLDAHHGRVQSVAFSPDGKTLLSGAWDGSVRFWDPATGKERRRLEGVGVLLATSPDGKTLVVPDFHGSFRYLDGASGKERRRIEQLGSGSLTSAAFSPDGKLLAAGKNRFDGQWRGFFLHDAITGKELRQFSGHKYNVKSLAFSPDGKTLASGAEDNTLRLWETVTGKERLRLQHQHWVETVAFSADGELLVSADARSIRFWAPSSGKELRKLDVACGASCVAFSPDGKTLASGECSPAFRGYFVCLREVATGKEICRWTGHRNGVSSLAFSPDGRTLASGAWDSVILVWDVTGLGETGRRSATPLVRKDLEDLWEQLAAESVPLAYRAVWKLASAPAQAAPFLADRLRPAPAADAALIARLVSDLDSEKFVVRESASAELERLGAAAEPALHKALAEKPSAELRLRVRRLLKKREEEAGSQERLRVSRALQVLEHGGTAEARRVLGRLAGGAAEAWQSREAKAAMERLKRRR